MLFQHYSNVHKIQKGPENDLKAISSMSREITVLVTVDKVLLTSKTFKIHARWTSK